jgi:hypothetical protein
VAERARAIGHGAREKVKREETARQKRIARKEKREAEAVGTKMDS